MDHKDEKLIIRYLLGNLDQETSSEFEEAYFNEDRLFGLLLEAEEDLIQRYVAGTLSAEDRDNFERHFLSSPARKHRVESARSALSGPPGFECIEGN